jgi:cell division protein FtsL
MPHQTIHISLVENNNEYIPASPTDSYASTEALYIPAPGTPYQTTSPTGALPLIENPLPSNATWVLAVDLAISATQPAVPLSPCIVSAIIEGQANTLTAPVLLRMVRGLVLTAKHTEDRMEAVRLTAEEQAMELERSKDQCDVLALGARNLQLEHNAQAESLRLANLTIRRLAAQPARENIPTGIQSEAPAGFIENNSQLHYFSIPLQSGSNDCRIAPYIQLLDGPVPRTAGTMGGPDDPVFTTEVYAKPSSNIGIANPPVPKWLLRAIDGDSEIFDAFALEVQDMTQDWGLYTDICRYHHVDTQLTSIATCIRALEAKEAETCNTLANCCCRLCAANVGETLAHLTGNDADHHHQHHGEGIIRYTMCGHARI